MSSDPVLRYGIHAGKRVSELPTNYVMWWADRPEALADNAVARSICARACRIAEKYIGDYEPGKGIYENYDPPDNDWLEF